MPRWVSALTLCARAPQTRRWLGGREPIAARPWGRDAADSSRPAGPAGGDRQRGSVALQPCREFYRRPRSRCRQWLYRALSQNNGRGSSEKHWHGATATTGMSHIAIQEALDGKVVEWLQKVSDEEYLAAPSAG